MDTAKLLRLLNERSVDYVVIGAMALPMHGYARATLDIDVFIRASSANAEHTLEALAEFGYDVHDVSADDLRTKKVLIRQYRRPPVRQRRDIRSSLGESSRGHIERCPRIFPVT